MSDQRFAEQIKPALREANRGGGSGDFAEDVISQQARCQQPGCVGIINADIEGIFDRHYQFNSIQSHGGIFGSVCRKRQETVYLVN